MQSEGSATPLSGSHADPDVVGRQDRLDLLDAAGSEVRRVHPHAAQDGHVRHPRSPDATAHISSLLARRPRPRG